MKQFATVMIALVALEHLYILVMETMLWTTRGLKAFDMTLEYAQSTATFALNQGFYNGVLAAGLLWTFFIKNVEWSRNVALFFLGAVVAMGIVGGLSVKISILYLQAAPALVGLVATYLAGARDMR